MASLEIFAGGSSSSIFWERVGFEIEPSKEGTYPFGGRLWLALDVEGKAMTRFLEMSADVVTLSGAATIEAAEANLDALGTILGTVCRRPAE